MTQQALRELVALAEELELCAEEHGSRDTWQTENNLERAKRDFSEAARNAIPHLKALLGEQREAQGMVPADEADQSIELALALGEVGASKVIAERIVTVLREVEALTEGRTDAFWAGMSMACEEIAERLQIKADLTAPPLAESVGDVRKAAVEIEKIYNDYDTWNPDSPARQGRINAVADIIRKHIGREG